MKSKTEIVFILITVGISCLIAGCTSDIPPGIPPVQTPAGTSTGFSSMNTPGPREEFRTIMETDFIEYLVYPGDIVPVNLNETGTPVPAAALRGSSLSLHSITGRNLDASGKADIWIYTVSIGNASYIITDDRYGRQIHRWNATVPGAALHPDRIISPSALFSRNNALIFPPQDPGIGRRLDLSLVNGTYTLTISGDTAPRILRFDAVTGAER